MELYQQLKKIKFKSIEMPDRVIREVRCLAKMDHQNVVRYQASWIEFQDADPEVVKSFCEHSIGFDSATTKPSEESTEGLIFTPTDSGSPHPKTITNGPDPSHPPPINIINVLYIKMQLCEITLQEWLDREDRVPDTNTNVQIFIQIARGMEYVHSLGMIHRDMKPANIFINRNPAGEYDVKIGDFGLAKELIELDERRRSLSGISGFNMERSSPGNRSTHTGRIGTKIYAAPEQENSREYTEKADIYSIGIIFFEMSYHFYTKMERVKVLTDLRNSIFPPKFTADHQLEATFISWMLANDPEQRPSATEILRTLIKHAEQGRIAKLQQEIEEKDRKIAEQERTIEKLMQQLQGNSNQQDTNLHQEL